MSGCGQEMCHNWSGSGCVCEVLGIEPEDTADYGPMGNPQCDLGPDETRCWNCDHLALDHTPGRWSIYGVCPTNTKETN